MSLKKEDLVIIEEIKVSTGYGNKFDFSFVLKTGNHIYHQMFSPKVNIPLREALIEWREWLDRLEECFRIENAEEAIRNIAAQLAAGSMEEKEIVKQIEIKVRELNTLFEKSPSDLKFELYFTDSKSFCEKNKAGHLSFRAYKELSRGKDET